MRRGAIPRFVEEAEGERSSLHRNEGELLFCSEVVCEPIVFSEAGSNSPHL
jgi:hypothetical protein